MLNIPLPTCLTMRELQELLKPLAPLVSLDTFRANLPVMFDFEQTILAWLRCGDFTVTLQDAIDDAEHKANSADDANDLQDELDSANNLNEELEAEIRSLKRQLAEATAQ